jgi:hypothetical protein
LALPPAQIPAVVAALLPLIIVLVIWELIWKGIGLWRAGRNNQVAWFVCILVFNTLGLLPILYLAFFQKETPVRAKKT